MRVLVTGAGGQLGGYVLRRLSGLGPDLFAWSHRPAEPRFGVALRPVDVIDHDGVDAAFNDTLPDVVVHMAAVSTPAAAYRDPELARAVNIDATVNMAKLAADLGARMIFLSTDMLFDGEKGMYTERDATDPPSLYGRTKLEAEQYVLDVPNSLVLRLSLLFGPTLIGQSTFFDAQCQALREGAPVKLFEDEWRTPLGMVQAAEAIAVAIEQAPSGLFHLGGPERVSRYEMGCRLAVLLEADPSAIVKCSRLSIESQEPRPADTSLDATRWCSRFKDFARPSFEQAVQDLLTAGK